MLATPGSHGSKVLAPCPHWICSSSELLLSQLPPRGMFYFLLPVAPLPAAGTDHWEEQRSAGEAQGPAGPWQVPQSSSSDPHTWLARAMQAWPSLADSSRQSCCKAPFAARGSSSELPEGVAYTDQDECAGSQSCLLLSHTLRSDLDSPAFMRMR